METNFAEANVYELEGKNVRITYQRTKLTQGEQVHYKGALDGTKRDLTFKEVEGQIEVLESKIGKMLTVELNPEEVPLDVPLATLTLLVPQVSITGRRSSLETQAILTTHTFQGLGFTGGPHQLYEVVPLKGTAFHAD
jgi:hypothetical protein